MNNVKFKFNNNEYSFFYNPEDTSGLGCISEIVIRNEYKLDRFVGLKESTFIDIGANCGVNTIILAKQNPESIIYAYEPYYKTYELLQKNISENKLTNVRAFNLAVSKKGINKLMLSIHETMTGANSTYAENLKFSNQYGINQNFSEVECDYFDNIIEKFNIAKVELLKIDCEGAEYDILYNSKALENNKIKNIVGEFHDLKYNQCDNNSSKLIEHCKKYINGSINITVLSA